MLIYTLHWPSLWPTFFLLANASVILFATKGKLFPTDLVILAAFTLLILDSVFPQYYMPMMEFAFANLLIAVAYLTAELLIMQLTVWVLEGTWGSFFRIPWDEEPYAHCLLSGLILISIHNEKRRRKTFWTQKLDLLFCIFMWFSPFIFM